MLQQKKKPDTKVGSGSLFRMLCFPITRFFWDVLEELSFRDHMTVNQAITKLYLESLDADHDIGNFTSFLRVCCSRYLSLIADGCFLREAEVPLGDVDAKNILEQEVLRHQHRKTLFSNVTQKPSIN